MARRHVNVPTPALALRRAEAAASLGLSVETFDANVRPHIPACRLGAVVVYPVAGIERWLTDNASTITGDIGRAAA